MDESASFDHLVAKLVEALVPLLARGSGLPRDPTQAGREKTGEEKNQAGRKKRKRRRRPGTLREAQCRKCQLLGHTEASCTSMHPRCAVCADDHPSDICIQLLKDGKSVSRKCVLCGRTGHSSPSYHCPARKLAKKSDAEVQTPTAIIDDACTQTHVRSKNIRVQAVVTTVSCGTQTDPQVSGAGTQTTLRCHHLHESQPTADDASPQLKPHAAPAKMPDPSPPVTRSRTTSEFKPDPLAFKQKRLVVIDGCQYQETYQHGKLISRSPHKMPT